MGQCLGEALSEISTSCQIDAPPARVWAILTDFARYGDWHTMLRAAEGVPETGGVLLITIPVGSMSLRFSTTMERCEPEEELCWTWRMPPLVHAEHYFRLAPEDGGTLLTHGERFSGLIGWLIPLLGRLKPATYTRLNAALKARAEGNYFCLSTSPSAP